MILFVICLIVRCCIRRGVMREIPFGDIYRHQGVPVLNGAFGVLKKGKVNALGVESFA